MNDLDIQKIAEEYERSLVIPEQKPIPQFFLCPVGLVGSGKSTVMKALCDRLSLLRISNDEIREIINDIRYYDDYPPQIASILIKKYALKGYSIGLDSNSSAAWGSEKFNNLLEEFGAKAIWIHINSPEEYILEKLSNHPPSKLFRRKEEALNSYYKSKETVKTEGIPFVYEFDPSRMDFSRQLDEATEKIIEELKRK